MAPLWIFPAVPAISKKTGAVPSHSLISGHKAVLPVRPALPAVSSCPLPIFPCLVFPLPDVSASSFMREKRYRFATYHRASVLHWGPDGASVSQGRWKLHVTRTGNDQSRPLHAPQHGDMSRTVYESIAEPVFRYQFDR